MVNIVNLTNFDEACQSIECIRYTNRLQVVDLPTLAFEM